MNQSAKIELQHFSNYTRSADYRYICNQLYGWENEPIDDWRKVAWACELGKGVASVSRQINRFPQHWLTGLGQFEQRLFVNPELFLCALSSVAVSRDVDFSIDILMSQEVRQAVCQITMLNAHGFDRSLNQAISQYPRLVRRGTENGSYGRFIRMNGAVTPGQFTGPISENIAA